MATLAKGLAVLGCFGKERPAMTLSEAAVAANVSRATARRILRTLAELGYVEQHGRQFSLSPNILQLGFAYLATQSWIDRAAPLMKELSERGTNPVRPRSCRGPISSMWRASRPGGSCRWRRRWGAACRRSIPPWAASSSVSSTRPRSAPAQIGAHRADDPEHDHRPAGAVRPHPRRSRAGVLDRRRGARARAARDRGPDHGSSEGRSWRRSISAPTRRVRPATRCATGFCRSCAPPPRRSPAFLT